MLEAFVCERGIVQSLMSGLWCPWDCRLGEAGQGQQQVPHQHVRWGWAHGCPQEPLPCVCSRKHCADVSKPCAAVIWQSDCLVLLQHLSLCWPHQDPELLLGASAVLSPRFPVKNELPGLQGVLSGSKALDKPGQLPRFYLSETPCFGFLWVWKGVESHRLAWRFVGEVAQLLSWRTSRGCCPEQPQLLPAGAASSWLPPVPVPAPRTKCWEETKKRQEHLSCVPSSSDSNISVVTAAHRRHCQWNCCQISWSPSDPVMFQDEKKVEGS